MPSFHIVRRLSVRATATVDEGRKAPSEPGVEGSSDRTSYRQLLRTPGLSALIVSLSIAHFGGGLWELTLILYTLQEWDSAELVGIVVLASWMPGILMSPIAGLLMDTRRRAPLVVLDFCVSATTAFAIVALASADLLEPWLLVAIVGVGSLTIPFGDIGRRTLLAVIPDYRNWDRTNALESASSSVTSTAAPAVAGLLVGIGAAELGLAVGGVLLLAAALILLRTKEPAPHASRHIDWRGGFTELRDAWRAPILRGLALTVFVDEVAIGILEVAVPVWMLERFGVTGFLVGVVWSAFNLSSFGVTVALGAVGTDGREPRVMTLGLSVQIVGLLLLLVGGAPWWTIACMAVAGSSIGLIDVSMFSMLQRAVPRGQLARSNAVALMIRSLGIPIGAMLAGIVAAVKPSAALALAALMAALAATILNVLLRESRLAGGPRAA
jgi:MFS family permease